MGAMSILRMVAAGSAAVAALAASPPANVVAAFRADGFEVVTAVQYGSGWGIAAASTNATIGPTGMRKVRHAAAGG
jgi:hypothetical protein